MRINSPSCLSRKASPNGAYIAFEGVNGAGKSTLINKISEKLNSEKLNHILTREPGGTLLGKKLREILKEWNENEELSPLSELFLFQADRAQHAAKIRASLKNGISVFSDRCFYSSLAFQGGGSGQDESLILSLSEIALEGTYPDLVVLLDLDPSAGLKRCAKSPREIDRFEDFDEQYHERVRNKFLELADTRPEACLIVDASKTPQEIFEIVFPFVHSLCK